MLFEINLCNSVLKFYWDMIVLFLDFVDIWISYVWMGFVGYIFDMFFYCGEDDGFYYVMGYCGFGIGMVSYLGMCIG